MKTEKLVAMLGEAQQKARTKRREIQKATEVLDHLEFFERLLRGILDTHKLHKIVKTPCSSVFFFMSGGKPALLRELSPRDSMEPTLPRISLEGADSFPMRGGKMGYKIRIVRYAIHDRFSTSDFLVSFEDGEWEADSQGPITYTTEK